MLDGVGVVASAGGVVRRRRLVRETWLPRISERIFIDPRLHLALSLLAGAGAADGAAVAGACMAAAVTLLLSIVARPELNGRPAGAGPFSAVELGLLLWKSNAGLGTARCRLLMLTESALTASMACLVICAFALPLEAVAVAAAINLASLAALRLSLASIVRADLAGAA